MTTLHDAILEKPTERKSIGVGHIDHADATSSSSGPSSLVPESLSSASSFQSLSSKSSSGICADSAPGSPEKTILLANSSSSTVDGFDRSYVNVDIPDLDDLISACANINLGGHQQYREADESPDDSADLSQDQTFASAADDTIGGDVTQVLIEETIQTFKTCPGLEKQPSEKSETPVDQPAVVDQPTVTVDSPSSVIPYVSFEQSVLRKNPTDDEPVAVDSLKVDSPRRRSYSPTPCVEIDVAAQLTAQKSENSFVGAAVAIGQRIETLDTFGTPDVSFQEVQAFDSTVALNTEDSKSVAAAESLNLTTFVSAPEAFVQKDITAPSEVNLLNKTQDIVVESSPINKTQEIVVESNPINKTQEILVVSNPVNKTQEIVVESNPINETQEIVVASNPIDKTQEIVVESNPINKIQEIVVESTPINKTQETVEQNNLLHKTQNIVAENSLLNETQEAVKEVKESLNKTQEIVKEDNILNNTQEIVKEPSFNKTQEIVKEASFNKTQEIVKETSFNKAREPVKEENTFKNTQDTVSETNVANKTQDFPKEEQVSNTSSVPREEQSTPSTVTFVSLDTNKFDTFKEPTPVISVKTPSKLYATKESRSSPNLESFYYDESQNSDVVASTPLHWKKDDNPRTPKRKSALFTQDPKSPPQFPSPGALSKNYNSPSKDKATKEQENKVNFDQTVAVNRSFEKSSFTPSELISKNSSLELLPSRETDYEAFKPQQQSTTLPFNAQCPNFEALQEAALSVAKEIDESLEKIEEEQFVSATTELFGDPSALDFLTQHGSVNTNRGDRYDSLYMKFDPLAQRQSMLPQKNLPVTPALEEEEEQRETKVDTSLAGTPKKNPALAAIDRLLFYSPCPPATTDSEKVEAKQKKEEAEKKEPQSVPVVNEEMAKELELVRSTVLQLEAELEKQRQEHQRQLEKQRMSYDDKVMQIQAKFGQMQSQLSQETKCKDQMTVVVEEYEKSISRLIAEREKEKLIFMQERDRIKAELDISQQHLANSEAAFTDVHSKYERLKSVVTAYKSNEEVLKESISENQETIKTLENRYEQLKSHAMAQLEKANLELSAIKKQHEADVLKLKAMVRKTELRCKTLEETVEQKSKENKELTQIIDEMIARVD